MPSLTVDRSSARSRQALWDVIADFPDIARWNSGVKLSEATSEAVEGVGAQRHCDLSPAGSLEETIAEWEPPSRMVVTIDEATTLPIESARVTFTLAEADDGTAMTLHYDYNAKWGPLGRLIAPLLNKQLTKGFTGFLEEWDDAAAT